MTDDEMLEKVTRMGDGPEFTYVIQPDAALAWFDTRHPGESFDRATFDAELDALLGV